MSSRERPAYSPAAAIELTWWKQPAHRPRAANSSARSVPSMFAWSHRLGAGVEVVDGAEMEEVLDLALELAQVGPGHAELRLAEVALDRDHPPRASAAPERVQLVELADRLGRTST